MTEPMTGVWLGRGFDLAGHYGPMFKGRDEVRLLRPEEVTDPGDVRFALCWKPGPGAFSPYPNLELVMSVAAGVDGLIDHPELPADVAVARVRDPHQAAMMGGYAAHEVLHVVRGFAKLERNALAGRWAPVPARAPEAVSVSVLGHGSMGREVARVLSALGFGVRVACRSFPDVPLDGVRYLTGQEAVEEAATEAEVLINVLPLTEETAGVLNADLFAKMKPNGWLIQIGRGEHLVEADLDAALETGQLAGATLDVFRQEPLPEEHRYWRDPRLRITPHVASDSLPEVVVAQAIETVSALRDGKPMSLAIDREKGY